MKSRYEGIQNKLWGIREGCFFLTLLSIAEEERERLHKSPVKVDFVDAVNKAFEKNWITSDYTVCDDCAILSWLTGENVTKETKDKCLSVHDNQYSVMKYCNKVKSETDPKEFIVVYHFRRRYFDVYLNSRTVREGTVMCYYIYTFG